MATHLKFDRTTAIVARNLGVTTAELLASFRPAVATDLEAIVVLREAIHGAAPSWDDRRYLAWRYGLGTTRKAYAIFRVLQIRGEIIAGIGAEEFGLHTPRGDTPAACAMDILCLDRYRSLGLGAWLNLALFEQYPVVLVLGSNVNSRGLVEGLYTPLEARSEYKFPINAHVFLRRRLRFPLFGPLAALVIHCMVLARGRWFAWWNIRQGVSVRKIGRFGIDAGAQLEGAVFGGRISIARNPDYLNWRFLDNTRCEYRALGSFQEGRLRSYVIYSCGSPDTMQHCLQIADWWIDDPTDLAPFRSLVAALVRDCQRRNVQFIRAIALGTDLFLQLRKSGFVHRSRNGVSAGFHSTSKSVESSPGSACTWNLTGLGDDNDLASR